LRSPAGFQARTCLRVVAVELGDPTTRDLVRRGGGPPRPGVPPPLVRTAGRCCGRVSFSPETGRKVVTVSEDHARARLLWGTARRAGRAQGGCPRNLRHDRPVQGGPAFQPRRPRRGLNVGENDTPSLGAVGRGDGGQRPCPPMPPLPRLVSSGMPRSSATGSGCLTADTGPAGHPGSGRIRTPDAARPGNLVPRWATLPGCPKLIRRKTGAVVPALREPEWRRPSAENCGGGIRVSFEVGARVRRGKLKCEPRGSGLVTQFPTLNEGTDRGPWEGRIEKRCKPSNILTKIEHRTFQNR